MADILSQDEINALMAAYGSGAETPALEVAADTPSRQVRIYDFTSPDRFSKEHLRMLTALHSDFAGGLTGTLTGMYQLQTRVNLIGTDQVSYKEYRASVPSKTLIAEVTAEPLSSSIILEVNPSVVGLWVDVLCGANPQSTALPSNLTQIDLCIAKRVLETCLSSYSESWSGMVAIDPQITKVSNSESFDEPMSPSEAMLVCSFEILTGGPLGMMTLAIPAGSVEHVLPNLSAARLTRSAGKQDKDLPHKIRRQLEQVNIPCKVLLGHTSISLPEARNLKVGDVIKTNRPINGQLEVMVGNNHLFNARPGVCNKNMAVVITNAIERDVEPLAEEPQQQQQQVVAPRVEEYEPIAA